jgi:hypothetical protein
LAIDNDGDDSSSIGCINNRENIYCWGVATCKKKMVEQYQAQITTLEGNLVKKSL